jgi:hypothetical protein
MRACWSAWRDYDVRHPVGEMARLPAGLQETAGDFSPTLPVGPLAQLRPLPLTPGKGELIPALFAP